MLKDFFYHAFKHNTTKKRARFLANEHQNLEAYLKKREKQKEANWNPQNESPVFERPIYYAYPSMKNFYAAMSVIWKYIMGFIVIGGIGIIVSMIIYSIGDMGLQATLNNFKEMLLECRWYHIAGLALFILAIIGLFALSPFMMQYLENTEVVFTNCCVYVKRYLLKDKTVTYEELEKCIKRRKIHINNGGRL